MKFYEIDPEAGTAREISGEEYTVRKAAPAAGGCLAVVLLLTFGIFVLGWKIAVGWVRLTLRHPGAMLPINGVIAAFVLFVGLLFTPYSIVNAPVRTSYLNDASGSLHDSARMHAVLADYYGPYTTIDSVTNVTNYSNGKATACVKTDGLNGSQTQKLYLEFEWDFRGRYWQVKGVYPDTAC
jgi:hypothetical protein